jgi:Ca2+-binding EF-hand superfamily protein
LKTARAMLAIKVDKGKTATPRCSILVGKTATPRHAGSLAHLQTNAEQNAARAMLAIKVGKTATPGQDSESQTIVTGVVDKITTPTRTTVSSIGSLAHLEIYAELNVEEIEGLRQVFEVYDRDHDGTVTEQELLEVFLSLGKPVTEKDVHALMVRLDCDGNGSLDFDEFYKYMGGEIRKVADVLKSAAEMFHDLDPEEAGSVTLARCREFYYPILKTTMSEDDFDDTMKALDADGNGMIDIDEFAELFRY